ncbi:MAG: hypothetical protein GY952_13050 [Rhodobacteraceae bacterium]|nr:hypothetical protein [Paracoccaceae bacterium]
MQQPYITYLLTNLRHDAFFAGTTRDLEFAVATHRHGIADIFTRTHKLTELVWYQADHDLISALRRKLRVAELPSGKKADLVEAENPEWVDLMPCDDKISA